MTFTTGKLRRLLPYVFIFGLLGGVYLLPPDTSLAEVRKAGVLRACMPPSYPPLVTGDRDAPGIDVELLQALAKTIVEAAVQGTGFPRAFLLRDETIGAAADEGSKAGIDGAPDMLRVIYEVDPDAADAVGSGTVDR